MNIAVQERQELKVRPIREKEGGHRAGGKVKRDSLVAGLVAECPRTIGARNESRWTQIAFVKPLWVYVCTVRVVTVVRSQAICEN